MGWPGGSSRVLGAVLVAIGLPVLTGAANALEAAIVDRLPDW